MNEVSLKELINRKPGKLVKELEAFALEFRLKDYILLRTIRGNYALLRIDGVEEIKKKDEERVVISWILNPGDNENFRKEDIKLLYDPKQKPEVITGVTLINSLTEDEPTAFSFDKQELVLFEMHEEDIKIEQDMVKYYKVLQSIGDISYRYNKPGRGEINISSETFGVIGRGSLRDFAETDLAPKIHKGLFTYFKAKYGTILSIKTLEGKYALIRIEEISKKGLHFSWISA